MFTSTGEQMANADVFGQALEQISRPTSTAAWLASLTPVLDQYRLEDSLDTLLEDGRE